MKSLVLDDVVKEFAIGAVLHNEIQLSLGFNNLVELNDVWMPNFFQNFNLPRDALYVFFLFDAGLFKDFDSDKFLSEGVRG